MCENHQYILVIKFLFHFLECFMWSYKPDMGDTRHILLSRDSTLDIMLQALNIHYYNFQTACVVLHSSQMLSK